VVPESPATELLSWADDFEAGAVNDPSLLDGSLDPGEYPAVRLGPACAVALRIEATGPVVTSVGQTGTVLATNVRVHIIGDGNRSTWMWSDDVGEVIALRDGLGVAWTPSRARLETGVNHLEGLVIPDLAAGKRPAPAETRSMFVDWMKLMVAWRASRDGGLARWRAEFRDRYRV
jgi:hypothetical protein